MLQCAGYPEADTRFDEFFERLLAGYTDIPDRSDINDDDGYRNLKSRMLITNPSELEFHWKPSWLELKAKVDTKFEKFIREVEHEAKFPGISKPPERIDLEEILNHTSPEMRIHDCQHTTVMDLLNEARVKREQSKLCKTEENAAFVAPNSHPAVMEQAGRDSERNRAQKKAKRSSNKALSRVVDRTECASTWPGAEHGLFCLLRGFLTLGGERRRLTTAQLCEYVREWQTQNGAKLQRLGGAWGWISRTEDWSAITPYALQFLTAEAVPANLTGLSSPGVVRHSSRRLTCPRPFVDSKPRVHQWSWLLAPPPPNTSTADSQLAEKFDLELKELSDMFTEWLRAPRGLGGLADAEWMASSSVAATGVAGRRKSSSKVEKSSGSADEQSKESDDSGRLQIIGATSDSDSEEPDHKRDRKSKSAGKRRPHVTTTVLDDTVPLPLSPTTWKLQPFTPEQKRLFQQQEADRFLRPWLPFVYHIQDYTCVVGPLRSASTIADQRSTSVQPGSQARARDHPLLRPDRPIHVSLAEIVRDAVACLPNGEGTRADITVLVQNSGYLLPTVNHRKLQQCVSSALDRLQGEAADPSVYYNAARRVWVYRHRNRTPEEFAALHEARCAVNEAKKSLQRGEVCTGTSTKSHSGSLQLHPHDSEYPRIPYGTSARARIPPQDDHSLLQRHLGIHRSDMGHLYQSDEDAQSDLHIPDIEELEAADMMRQARGELSDYSEQYSSYDDEEIDQNDDYGDDADSVSRYMPEGLSQDGRIKRSASEEDYLYPSSFERIPLKHCRESTQQARQPQTFQIQSPQHYLQNEENFLELHKSIRR
ncbi:unnamed protein product [Dicrocoelium dendriticum]|nr:unnamed protein product [Dicrocoelium dendriticum]